MTTQASEDKIAQEFKRLNIRNQDELKEFWVQILPAFVDFVDPDSGFLIDLYSGGELLTDTDYESLVTGKDHVPTKHRARRLWCILSTYPLSVFRSKLAPKLCARYGPIIPERFLTTPAEGPATDEAKPEEQCLRHDIQNRVRLETLADLLCHHGCLPQEVYRKLFTKMSRNVGDNWNLLFDSLAQCPDEMLTNLESPLQKLLNRYHVTCPDNIVVIQSRGFPCECEHPHASPPAMQICTKTKVLSWRERALFAVHKSSSGSSVTNVDVSNSSLLSSLRPVSASSGRSDIMVTKTSSESDSHFDGMLCNRVGFPPSEKLTRKSVSEVNISSDSSSPYRPKLARARTDDCLDRSSSNDGECIPLNKSALKDSRTYVAVEHDVSEVSECTEQTHADKKSLSEMGEQEGDVDVPESMELVMSSDGNYETSTAETCHIDVPDDAEVDQMKLMAGNDTGTELPVDEIQVLLDHGPRAFNYAVIVPTLKNCLDQLVADYEDNAFFAVFRRELHWAKTTVKDISQKIRLCTDKYSCRKRKFPPLPKQMFKVVWRAALLALCFTWLLMVGTMGWPLETKWPSLEHMWAIIFIVLHAVLVLVLQTSLRVLLPALCCKMLCARVVTSVWVLWKMFKTKPVVEVLSDMQEGETYQTTSV